MIRTSIALLLSAWVLAMLLAANAPITITSVAFAQPDGTDPNGCESGAGEGCEDLDEGLLISAKKANPEDGADDSSEGEGGQGGDGDSESGSESEGD